MHEMYIYIYCSVSSCVIPWVFYVVRTCNLLIGCQLGGIVAVFLLVEALPALKFGRMTGDKEEGSAQEAREDVFNTNNATRLLNIPSSVIHV